jgi:hypothetical protein
MAGYTYTSLVQAVQDFTDNNEAVFVSQIDNFIQNAEERILKMIAPLQVFRKNATTTATVSNQYLQKPSDWLATYTISIVDSNGDKKFLINKDVNFVQEYWPDATVAGEPKYYADFDVSNFILAPTPATSNVMEIHYFYRPESLTTASSGVTWISENAGLTLLYATLSEAYTFMKGEPDMIQAYEQKFMQAAERLSMFAVQAEGLDTYKRSVA